MRRIGIYSGSFDPIHDGHLAFAHQTAKQCGLETVVFIPERQPPSKPDISPIEKRLAVIGERISETPFTHFVSPEPTLRTRTLLPELQALYPNSQFVFLVGSDVVRNSLPYWDSAGELMKNHVFAVGMRANDAAEEIAGIFESMDACFFLVETEYSHLSSTQIRLSQPGIA